MSSIRAKRNIWWSAPPHPIPPHPFAMFRREKFCTDFQKASDAVPITCFHLSSPLTDTTLLTDGKSRGCAAWWSQHARGWQQATPCSHPSSRAALAKEMAAWMSSWKPAETTGILSKKKQPPKTLPVVTAKHWYLRHCCDSSPSAEITEVHPHPCLGNS